MKCKSIACLIILLNIAGIIVLASSGYDSIECDPNSNRARKGRARLIESIPCDLSKQSYCNLPGDSYPWNAVKKFVYDNQGLVRRMYGDLRHIFVMQSELENEIDFDDIKLTADKYSKAFNTHNKPRHRQMKANKKVAASATTSTRNAERKNYRSGDATEPHFRPAQRPSAINTKQRTKPTKVNINDDQSEKTSLIDNLIQTNIESLSNTKSNEKATSPDVTTMTTNKTTKLTSVSSSTTPSSSTTISEISNDDSRNSIVNSHQNKNDEESDLDEKNETVDKAAIDLFRNISSALSAGSTTSAATSIKTSTESITTTASVVPNKTTEEPSIMTKNKVTTVDSETLEEEVDEILSELVNDSTSSASSTNTVVDEKIDEKGQTSSKDPLLTTTTEAQLYQDAIPMANRRGVNACPVKEEVVAPFWGNNTRGEILALLNVYPFEQYINWEKCTNENEQMYCRKGCRCEQQYRLHRLLAYNPLDACRGIFSDWFRFPSCCICKCYDIPFDYRVTSRSPRGSERVLDAISDNDEEYQDDAVKYDENDEDSEGNYYFDEEIDDDNDFI